MDIAKPGTLKTAAAASARPVIVTNRVVIQDPMVKTDDKEVKPKPADSAEPTSPIRSKIVIKPISDPSEATDQPATEKSDEKTEAAKEGLLDIPLDPSLTVDTDGEAADEPVAEQAPQPAENVPATEEPASEASSEAAEPDEPAADDDGQKKDKTDSTETAESSSDESEAAADNPLNPDKKAAAAEAASAKEQEELNRLIDDKEYFLPINSVERRRTRVVAVVGVLVIMVLAAAWVNVALDAGFIEIPGVQPLTHFFNAK